MSIFYAGRKFRKGKPRSQQIDWSHPLAKGLVFYVPFNEGTGLPRELVNCRGRSPAQAGGAVDPFLWTGSIYGDAILNDPTANGSGGTVWNAGAPYFNDANPVTLFGIAGPMANTGVQNHLIRFANTGSTFTNPWGIYHDNVNNVIHFTFNGADTANASSISSNIFSDGKMHVLAGTRMNVTNQVRLYVDGSLVSSTTVAGSVAVAAGNVFSANGAGTGAWRGQIACLAAWKRVLSQGDIQLLVEDPFTILNPPLYRRYFFSPPAPAPPIVRFVSPIINMPIQMP